MAALSFTHPRDELLALMQRIYGYRMTTTSGGNLSLKDDDGDVWITPARVDKGSLTRSDMVRIRRDGNIEGHRSPSSEAPFHLEIYRRRPDIRGIVHAHPVALVAFSLARKIPDTRLFHQSWNVCGRAGFAPYQLPGSQALGDSIAGTFQQGFDSVILENHGVAAGGATLQEAFHRFETLEFTAKTIIKGRLLGDVTWLSESELALAEQRSGSFETFARDSASSEERELRHLLCNFIHRAYRQRLFISTAGSYSVRLGADAFLMTPFGVDRAHIAPEDLVLVKDGRVEEGHTPSRALRTHAHVYQKHPGIGAIINAHPVNATAFSVTGTPLDTRTIPESYVVVRQPVHLPYGVHMADEAAIANHLSEAQPVAILQNSGVLVTGGNILEAFDRLEVLESTAEAIINSLPLGGVTHMGEDAIRELEAAFFKKA